MSELDRFLEAQEKDYEKALKEIQNGKRENHWIYYIFPQIRGLGQTEVSIKYGIKNIDEAIDFLKNETLRKNLLEISQVLLDKEEETDIKEIMGFPDNLKLKSSMTLFKIAEEKSEINCNGIFKKILDKYYNGEEDAMTLVILQKQNYQKEHGEESVNGDNIEKDLDDVIKKYQGQNIDLKSSINIEKKLSESNQNIDFGNNNEITNDNHNEEVKRTKYELYSSIIPQRKESYEKIYEEEDNENDSEQNCCKICNIM